MNRLKWFLQDENFNKQVLLFILLQPVIDIYRTLIGNTFQIMGLSLVEFVNMALVAYLFLLSLFHLKNRKKIACFIAYLLIIGIYFAIHSINILKFNTTIISNTDINVIKEIWYIGRAYVLPLFTLFIYVVNENKKDYFYQTITFLSIIISGIIIVTNIFKISFVAYASDWPDGTTISYNIFQWFSLENYGDVTLMTSKGLFYSGNQIGLILLMLYPIVSFNFLNKKNILNLFSVLSVPIAMMMIGTKTAAFGCIVVLMVEIILIILFELILHRKKSGFINIIILGCICTGSYFLLQHSPVILMQTAQENSYERNEDADKLIEEQKMEEMNSESGGKIKLSVLEYFLNDMPGVFGVHRDYVELYPVKQNPDFWYSVISDKSMAQVNFRDFKYRIFKEVKEDNNNPMDTWLGIGYTTNFPYVEKDVISQYVWLGIIGVILFLGPFYVMLLISGINILRNMKDMFTFENCVLGLSICSAFAVSYIAGHLFGFAFPSFILCYILAKLYKNTRMQGDMNE